MEEKNGERKPLKRQIFAFTFRCAAFGFCAVALLAGLGILGDGLVPAKLLMYTNQSNILVIAVFGMLAVKTGVELFGRKSGKTAFWPLLHMMTLLAILTTMLVFWGMLAPFAEGEGVSLWSFQNLGVHLVNPLLMLLDYVLFSESGHIRKRDPWLCMLVPLFYVGQAAVLMLAGVNYQQTPGGPHKSYPYFFLNWQYSALFAVTWVILIFGIFVAAAYLMRLFDRRREVKKHGGRAAYKAYLEARKPKRRAETFLEKVTVFLFRKKKGVFIFLSASLMLLMFTPVLAYVDKLSLNSGVANRIDFPYEVFYLSYRNILTPGTMFYNRILAALYFVCAFAVPLAIIVLNAAGIVKRKNYTRTTMLLFTVQAAVVMVVFAGLANTVLDMSMKQRLTEMQFAEWTDELSRLVGEGAGDASILSLIAGAEPNGLVREAYQICAAHGLSTSVQDSVGVLLNDLYAVIDNVAVTTFADTRFTLANGTIVAGVVAMFGAACAGVAYLPGRVRRRYMKWAQENAERARAREDAPHISAEGEITRETVVV